MPLLYILLDVFPVALDFIYIFDLCIAKHMRVPSYHLIGRIFHDIGYLKVTSLFRYTGQKEDLK